MDRPADGLGDGVALTAFLRGEGFRLGVGDDLRLAELRQRLGEQGIALPDGRSAARWLGPVLCRNPDQSERLPDLLDQWLERVRLERPGDVAVSAGERFPMQAGPPRPAASAPRALGRRYWPWVALAVLLLIGGLVFAVTAVRWSAEAPPAPTAVSLSAPDAAPQPAPDATPWWPGLTGDIEWTLARGLAALVPVAAAGAYLWSRRQRRLAVLRGLAPRDARRAALDLKVGDLPLFRPGVVRTALRDLRRHRLVPSDVVDGRASLAATVAGAGFVRLVRAKRPVTPDHLLLVDRVRQDDHLALLAELLVDRLSAEQVHVTRYDYRGDPRILQRVERDGRPGPMTDLETLREQARDHRLLLLTDAANFTDPASGADRGWVELLRRWELSAVVTPAPQATWGPRERGLMRRGFLVVEASPRGLRDLAGQVRSDLPVDRASPAGPEPLALDRRLARAPFDWTGDRAPADAQVAGLIGDLRAALGADGLHYLAALAVFPAVEPRLTLLVGNALTDADGRPLLTEDRLASLCRLPWLRRGRIPDWLRLALVRELQLDSDRAAAVRHAWTTLLAPVPAGERETLRFPIVPPTDADARAVINDLVRRGQAPDLEEAILLRFLNDLPVDAVNVELPVARQSYSGSGSSGFKVNARAAIIFAAFGLPFISKNFVDSFHDGLGVSNVFIVNKFPVFSVLLCLLAVSVNNLSGRPRVWVKIASYALIYLSFSSIVLFPFEEAKILLLQSMIVISLCLVVFIDESKSINGGMLLKSHETIEDASSKIKGNTAIFMKVPFIFSVFATVIIFTVGTGAASVNDIFWFSAVSFAICFVSVAIWNNSIKIEVVSVFFIALKSSIFMFIWSGSIFCIIYDVKVLSDKKYITYGILFGVLIISYSSHINRLSCMLPTSVMVFYKVTGRCSVMFYVTILAFASVFAFFSYLESELLKTPSGIFFVSACLVLCSVFICAYEYRIDWRKTFYATILYPFVIFVQIIIISFSIVVSTAIMFISESLMGIRYSESITDNILKIWIAVATIYTIFIAPPVSAMVSIGIIIKRTDISRAKAVNTSNEHDNEKQFLHFFRSHVRKITVKSIKECALNAILAVYVLISVYSSISDGANILLTLICISMARSYIFGFRSLVFAFASIINLVNAPFLTQLALFEPGLLVAALVLVRLIADADFRQACHTANGLSWRAWAVLLLPMGLCVTAAPSPWLSLGWSAGPLAVLLFGLVGFSAMPLAVPLRVVGGFGALSVLASVTPVGSAVAFPWWEASMVWLPLTPAWGVSMAAALLCGRAIRDALDAGPAQVHATWGFPTAMVALFLLPRLVVPSGGAGDAVSNATLTMLHMPMLGMAGLAGLRYGMAGVRSVTTAALAVAGLLVVPLLAGRGAGLAPWVLVFGGEPFAALSLPGSFGVGLSNPGLIALAVNAGAAVLLAFLSARWRKVPEPAVTATTEGHDESLPLWEPLDGQSGLAVSSDQLGMLAQARGDLDHAKEYRRRSSASQQTSGNQPDTGDGA